MTTTIQSRSPQDPDDLVADVPAATAGDVGEAAATARTVQRDWWDSGAAARATALGAAARLLLERVDEAAALVVREVGKPVGEARAEVGRAVAILDYYAQAAYAAWGETYPPSAGGVLWTERRPHGVAGLITPWNFPLAIPLWKAAPALAVGNAVLLKPSPEAVACATWLGELMAGTLPDGVLRVLPGGAEAGEAVARAADVVSFTGSVAVGSEVAVAATRRRVPVQAEMGGHNAAVVLPDADLGVVARVIAGAAMGFAGQKCTATRRVVVVGGDLRVREVTDALVAAVVALEPGDPSDDGVTVGPVVTAAARDRVVDAVDAVRSSGGRVLVGGAADGGRGWFVRPTLVDGLDPGHEVSQQEVFGPLAVVQAARDLDHAVALADGTPYGLVTSVHGRDAGPLLEVARRVRTGLVKVNAPTTGVDFYAPFGGEAASSIGPREQGRAALDFYASTRTVTFAPHGG
jgi:aldehyde dehydrogenase (NAD+)